MLYPLPVLLNKMINLRYWGKKNEKGESLVVKVQKCRGSFWSPLDISSFYFSGFLKELWYLKTMWRHFLEVHFRNKINHLRELSVLETNFQLLCIRFSSFRTLFISYFILWPLTRSSYYVSKLQKTEGSD